MLAVNDAVMDDPIAMVVLIKIFASQTLGYLYPNHHYFKKETGERKKANQNQRSR